LRIAGLAPQVSRQRTGVLVLVEDAQVGVNASRQLLNTVGEFAGQTALDQGAVPLTGLPHLQSALRQTGRELQRIDGTTAGLWPSLASARRRLDDVTRRMSNSLLEGADALGATRSLMGSDGPRRYLVGIQNNSEMRDQGMVLSYAILRVDAGRLTVERTGPINDFILDRPVDLALPAGTQAAFGSQNPLRLWQNANATADWPLTARTMSLMYRQATGTDVDGVMVIDVPGLAAILRVVGAVDNPITNEPITADNVGRVVLHDFYERPPEGDQGLRKERLGEVAASIIDKMTTGRHDVVALAQELGGAAAGGHFRLWSGNDAEERVFRRVGLGGGPAERRPDRTFHVSVQNASSSKLDYFQRQRARFEVYVTEAGTAVVRAELTLINTAPKNAQPSYQLGPGGATQKKPGEYPARIYFWGPRGGSQVRGVPESGLTLSESSTIVQPGEQEIVIFHAVIPKAVRDGRLDLRLVPQPILVPADLEVKIHAPGWSVAGETTISRPWDRTITVGWGLKS
jgi:hypothetical protein